MASRFYVPACVSDSKDDTNASLIIYICIQVIVKQASSLLDLYILLRIKLKCGLVCELTLRVNRHSKGQESPLSHHYVF